MSSAPGRNSHLSSEQAIIATKMSESHKAAKGGPSASSINLDDVIFLRLPEVKAVTGLSKSSLYALVRERSFPAPVRLGPRSVAWVVLLLIGLFLSLAPGNQSGIAR
jgi:prophage regulatory protein